MTSSSEGEILQTSQVIRDRWKIKQKVGGGGFGEIYEAIDLQNHNERVAVKVESSKATKQVLKMEVAVLRRLQGKKHACKFYGCGRNDKFNYLVMSLQGKNLADLRRESPKQCFSVSTALRLGLQILVGIREIHSIGFLHRDIKPSNFAMGRTNSTMRTVYMLDFGLARLYLNAKGEIRSPRSAAGFRGTVRYAAVSAHKNKEMGRQDDLWSLFYMLVEFLQGSLPWRRIKDKDEVGRMKDEADVVQLLDGCPEELLQMPTHLKTLGYPNEPDYDMLERCLQTAMTRLEIQMDDPYDWELGYENISGRSKATSGTTANVSTRMRSHTTAVRDKAPDDKNRALDTQAPITMGEDDDEQTGNCYRMMPAKSTHEDGQESRGDVEKPKYKRQEFMRPKYGAVSFDVIDAVNARLAAASSGSTHDLFSKMKVDTSVENDVNCRFAPGRDIEINVDLPVSIGQRPAFVETNAVTNGSPANAQKPPLTRQPSQEHKNSKSNRSITLSVGKRYQNGSKRHPSTTANSTNAVAEDDPANSHHRGQTTVSKWHDSFDDSAGDDHLVPMERSIERDSSAKRSPVPTRYNSGTKLKLSPPLNNAFPVSPSADDRHSGYLSPNSARRVLPISKSQQPLTSEPPTNQESRSPSAYSQRPSTAQSSPTAVQNGNNGGNGGGGLMSHFKNLVSTFNHFGPGSALSHVRRRSLSRGVSLDDNRRSAGGALQTAHSQTLQRSLVHSNGGSSAGHTTPASSVTTPTSGIGTGSGSLGGRKLISQPSASTTQRNATASVEDEEREARRQRRLRRRSDLQGMLPTSNKTDASLSPSRVATSVQKTVLLNGSPINDNGYYVESRLLNNGVLVQNTPPSYDDHKSSLSCRRKRYQFLNFAPRAMSKS